MIRYLIRVKELAGEVVGALLAQDCVGGIFADSRLGCFAGTLLFADIALEGGAGTTPRHFHGVWSTHARGNADG
jgi:hypothetical protein